MGLPWPKVVGAILGSTWPRSRVLLQASADACPDDEAVKKMKLELGQALQTKSGEQKSTALSPPSSRWPRSWPRQMTWTDEEKAELTTPISEEVGVDIPHNDAQERLEASKETLLMLPRQVCRVLHGCMPP